MLLLLDHKALAWRPSAIPECIFRGAALDAESREAIHHCAAVEYHVYIVDDICGFLGKRLAY